MASARASCGGSSYSPALSVAQCGLPVFYEADSTHFFVSNLAGFLEGNSENFPPSFCCQPAAKAGRLSKQKWTGWCARNTTHRLPKHLHKPCTAMYVHVRLCLNELEACFFSNLAKANRQLKGPARQAKSGRVVCSNTAHTPPLRTTIQ